MNFSFENYGTHTYLVYTVAEQDTVDSMSLGMLTNNKLPGFAQTMFTQIDATQLIKYDVSAKISVSQFFTGPVNKKRLVGVFRGIVDALLTAEDYMIDINSIILDLNYIYTDVSNCETAIICLPLVSDDLSQRDVCKFFKDVIFSVQIDPTENGDYFAKMINYLNASESFSLEDFKQLLTTLSGATPQGVRPQVQSAPASQPASAPQPAPQPQSQPRPQPVAQPQSQPRQPQVTVPPSRVTPAPGQMAIPGAPQTQIPPQPVAGTSGSEQDMSLLWLLQHYNSENAALYKQQKAAKKNRQTMGGVAVPITPAAPSAFSIPGQPTPPPAAQPAPQPVARPQASAQPPVVPRPAAPQPAPQPAPTPVYSAPAMPQAPRGQAMNFGETTVLGGGGVAGETTVLGASPMTQVKPYLIRARNNEKINVDKPVFRIGKERSYVDYFIADNSAISRSHANIIERNGEYFIVDTNSTNHTYVDGAMSPSNVETKIAHGAKIRLANEDFEFKLY